VNRKPKKWIAAVLGLFVQPAGMLYVARPGWAAAYLALALIVALVNILVLRTPQLTGDLFMLLVAIVGATQAYRFARDYENPGPRPWYSRWYGLIGILAAFAALAIGTRAFGFEPFRFPSGSMAPSIEPHAHLIVKKWGYGNYGTYGMHFLRTGISSEVQRGDILVFEYPEDPTVSYAKRVVGLPGDKISYLSKRLTVNGQDVRVRQVDEPLRRDRAVRSLQYLERLGDLENSILIEPDAPAALAFVKGFPLRERCSYTPEGVTCHVPNAHYYVLGDNRDNSSDSRVWGFVPAKNVVGKVQYILQ